MAHVRATKELVIAGRLIRKHDVIDGESIPADRLHHGLVAGVFVEVEPQSHTTPPSITFAEPPALSRRGGEPEGK